jgi:hypothetical protein
MLIHIKLTCAFLWMCIFLWVAALDSRTLIVPVFCSRIARLHSLEVNNESSNKLASALIIIQLYLFRPNMRDTNTALLDNVGAPLMAA